MSSFAPTVESLTALLDASPEDFSEIYRQADALRAERVGNTVHIRGLLEFSNICRRACTYCGLNCQNSRVSRYRMTPEELIFSGEAAVRAGYRTIVLQSGEDPYFTPSLLGEIVEALKKIGLTITLSCGEMPEEAYAYLKAQGADRYLLKHETADPVLFSRLHPDGTLEHRLNCLRILKRLGYETGGGFMIGFPGQTSATIAADLLLLREIPCDMAGIGPFIPHPNTPLGKASPGSTELTKRAVALARLLLPTCNLPATTALGVIDGEEKTDVFSKGANVVMKKLTPDGYREKYEIYPAPLGHTHISRDRALLEEQIRSLGRIPL